MQAVTTIGLDIAKSVFQVRDRLKPFYSAIGRRRSRSIGLIPDLLRPPQPFKKELQHFAGGIGTVRVCRGAVCAAAPNREPFFQKRSTVPDTV